MGYLLTRLAAMNARLDEVMEFATPNEAALNSIKGIGQVSRKKWGEAFRSARDLHKKPLERIISPVVKTPEGDLWEGPNHAIAIVSYASPASMEKPPRWFADDRMKGFKTTLQPFVSRGEARQIAGKVQELKSVKQVPEWRKRLGPGLHSQDLRDIPGV